MDFRRTLLVGIALTTVLIGGCTSGETSQASSADMIQAPMFEVDPFWPKPLPNHWILGSTIGVDVDSRDHVWIIHRQTTFAANTEIGAAQDPPLSECCIPAPNILEFDADGNLVNSWGGPPEDGSYEWPQSNHGITVDHADNVWIGGNGQADAHVLKFTRNGEFLMQIGSSGARMTGMTADGRSIYQGGSNDTENFGRVAEIGFHADRNEMYLADGYLNKRVAVLDASTGELKRFWGAYANVPDDGPLGRYSPDIPPAQQFRGPVHCAVPANDGKLYVCDRASDRIQVFTLDGEYLMEAFVAPETLSQGSTWDIALSKDADQKYIYLADGQNMKVHIIERATMEVLTTFGDGGRQPGQFFAVHSIATDSKGNIYTTETYEGKRVQKFVYKGVGSVAAGDQRTQGIWPGS